LQLVRRRRVRGVGESVREWKSVEDVRASEERESVCAKWESAEGKEQHAA
jgi:hypothetical protein